MLHFTDNDKKLFRIILSINPISVVSCVTVNYASLILLGVQYIFVIEFGVH